MLNVENTVLLVVLLCALLGKNPILLIRNSFIELAGGSLQDKGNKKQIEGILEKYLSPEDLLKGNYISKTGSNYLVIAYLDINSVAAAGPECIQECRQQIEMELEVPYTSIDFEVVLA